MSDSPPAEKPGRRQLVKGFACPTCVGVRLFVTHTRRPRRGLIVRYRTCSACGFQVVTEERPRPAQKTDARSGTPTPNPTAP